MTDTPQHIQELQLKLWLSRPPGERLCQFLIDNDAMLNALRKTKEKMGIPLYDLDFAGQYLENKQRTSKPTE